MNDDDKNLQILPNLKLIKDQTRVCSDIHVPLPLSQFNSAQYLMSSFQLKEKAQREKEPNEFMLLLSLRDTDLEC